MPPDKLGLIHNDEPRDFDALGRETELLGLSRIILSADPPLVVGVHGDWGAGKTSFMRVLRRLLSKEGQPSDGGGSDEGKTRFMGLPWPPWTKEQPGSEKETDPLRGGRRGYKQQAEKNGIASEDSVAGRFERLYGKDVDLPSVWFNPWEHQFEEEPVLPLLDAVRAQMPKSAWGRVKGSIKEVVENPALRIVGKAALGIGAAVGPGWISALGVGAAAKVADTAKGIFKDFSQLNDQLSDCFEQLLVDFPEIPKGEKEGKSPRKRMVIFIDDLDRCEAPYVVKILEALKLHLVNKHCVFVVGCADARVRACLVDQELAANDEAAKEYLEKIIQLPVRLPPVWEATLDTYMRSIARDGENITDVEFNLLSEFSGGNPRRLKRFLVWFELQDSMIKSVEGEGEKLSEKAAELLAEPGLLMKIKMLQFAEPYMFVKPAHFRSDRKETFDKVDKIQDAPELMEPVEAKKGEDAGDSERIGQPARAPKPLHSFMALEPHVGDWLDPVYEDEKMMQLLCVLALTTDENIAERRVEEKQKEQSAEAAAESAKIIEEAIREEIELPGGHVITE